MSNTIIRAPRRDRFVVMDQRAVEDGRLSWAARGLLCYLLSRPDDWKVLVNDLRKRGNLGRDGIYRLLRELRTVGYAQFLRMRDKHGRIRGGIYIIREVADSPNPELPDTVLPQTAVPGTANPGALPTTDIYLRRTTTTTPTTTKERSSCENENHAVEFAWWVPTELQESALAIVAELDPAEGQIVIDEWAGCMAAESIDISPLGYLQALVRRYRDGNFGLVFANDVADIRAKPPDDENGIVEIEICEADCEED
ncbi:helix-turn-helix domain-containing protein [Gammaproteobacteria bacterium]|nr:helix-turn-helix domain-containing protein [Gammaproteobacteria bacterium]